MRASGLFAGVGEFAERESLLPDLRRATRTTAAFMAPMVLAHWQLLAGPVIFAAIAAQNVALVDVRGAYRMRVSLLLTKALVLAGSTWLGCVAAGSPAGAVLATALIALTMGLWRHLSSDYGPSMAAASALLFLIALATPVSAAAPAVLYTLGGGLWAVALQASLWPFRPEHPLRQAAADTWLALGDLFDAMALDDARAPDARHQEVTDREATVRISLDRTTSSLAAASPSQLRERLEGLNLTAARLATRFTVFYGALDTLKDRPDFSRIASTVQPVLTSLKNTTRTVALVLVGRQPSQLATAEVRLQRLANLIHVLQARIQVLAESSPAGTELIDLLRQLSEQIPVLMQQLRSTLDRAAERGAFSLELFDLDAWTLRPLASTLNFSRRFDPALVRFTGRLGVLLMIGVGIFEYFKIDRGYWLPLTIVVVLQPDYGSTRLRAAQRLIGTLVGGTLASLLLWLKLPAVVLLVAIAATIFAFSYYLRKNYAIAVFFITLMIVLLTEASSRVTIHFTIERLLATAAGGIMAMLAALLFWPVWEWQRFPPILAKALRASRVYLDLLQARLASGGSYDAELVAAKRQTESANAEVFASLQRMAGDPKHQQAALAPAAAIANGNQRLARALTTMALHLTPGTPLKHPEAARFHELATAALEALARRMESKESNPGELAPLLAALENFQGPLVGFANDATTRRDQWMFGQMSRAVVELSAMLLAAAGTENRVEQSPSLSIH
ncbi:MAG: rane protein [Verrucomicrobia bacterium]|nr:rane protein [Verrucomicrobiota bacterium]